MDVGYLGTYPMSDSSDELEDGNIFQNARRLSTRKPKEPLLDNSGRVEEIQVRPPSNWRPQDFSSEVSELHEETDAPSDIRGSHGLTSSDNESSGPRVAREITVEPALLSEPDGPSESDGLLEPSRPIDPHRSSVSVPKSSNPDLQTIEELVVKLPYIELPLLDPSEPVVRLDMSQTRGRILKANNIINAAHELKKRISKNAFALSRLNSATFSAPMNDEVFLPLWKMSNQLGRLSALKIDAMRLRHTRADLMNEISELRSAAGLNSASANTYDQLQFQLEEAKKALERGQIENQSLKEVQRDLQEVQSTYAALCTECKLKDSGQLQTLSDEVEKIKTRTASQPSSLQISSLEQSIRETCKRFDATFEVGTSRHSSFAVISMLYMSVVIEEGKRIDFCYPKVLEPVYRHYETLVRSASSITEALRLWHKCLQVESSFREMLPYGPSQFETSKDGVVYRQWRLESGSRIYVRLDGTAVIIGETAEDVRDLPPLERLKAL